MLSHLFESKKTIVLYITIFISVVFGWLMCSLVNNITFKILEADIVEKEYIIDDLTCQVDTLMENERVLTELLSYTQSMYNDSVSDIMEMEAMYTQLFDEYCAYQELIGYTGVSLYNIAHKYMYVIEAAPEESELTLDNLVQMDALAAKYNINPHIVNGLFTKESNFRTNVKNSSSSATGIGQFLSGTGQYVYNVLLGYDDQYIHSVHANDPDICIPMTYAYLNYLMYTYDCDLWTAMKFYSGGSTSYPDHVIRIAKGYTGKNTIGYGYE